LKKALLFVLILSLMTTICACDGKKETVENVHERIHSAYYDIGSYTAKCTVNAYTEASGITYDCDVSYDKDNERYTVVFNDMTICTDNEKTVITKGENSLESPPSESDMCIFVNTFFESYYESEETSMSVSAAKASDTVMLECNLINPTKTSAKMKLWINKSDVTPNSMQVFDKNGFMHTEVIFNEFNGYNFGKSGE